MKFHPRSLALRRIALLASLRIDDDHVGFPGALPHIYNTFEEVPVWRTHASSSHPSAQIQYSLVTPVTRFISAHGLRAAVERGDARRQRNLRAESSLTESPSQCVRCL